MRGIPLGFHLAYTQNLAAKQQFLYALRGFYPPHIIRQGDAAILRVSARIAVLEIEGGPGFSDDAARQNVEGAP